MLRLKLPTDPRWVNLVEQNIEEILTDHAFCEQKAAASAMSILVQYPEKTELVDEMIKLAQEEMEHLKLVHEKIKARNLTLGRERKDPYVNDLQAFFRGGTNRDIGLVHKLLLAAMIEARSCERFRILSENIKDPDLALFYRDLMVSEANHYTLFLELARKYGKAFVDVDELWHKFLGYEAEVIQKYGKKEHIHG